MAKNTNLHKAKNAKNDEFYTQLTDVEKELKHYKNHFEDKTVYCNCDNEKSAFWEYFHLNFSQLKLKKLIATHYSATEKTYKIEYTGSNDTDITEYIKTDLLQDGDFRSEDSIEILKESDIVVTNPPFSLFREFVAQLMEYDKKFIIIGSQNAIAYKEVFPLIKGNRIWWGVSDCIRWFEIPDWIDIKYKLNEDGERIAEGARSRWYTNLDHQKRHESLILWKDYSPEEYPKYDNFDAINVDKVTDIPCDYFGIMGVPITFFDKYNPEQFEIIGIDRYTVPKQFLVGGRVAINGKPRYARLLVKRK